MTQKRMTHERWNAVFVALSLGIDQMEEHLHDDDVVSETEWRQAKEAFYILWDRHGKKGQGND